MVSFSLASYKTPEFQSYAIIGGYNSSQIVGGADGLKVFKNYHNYMQNWALKAQGLHYDSEPLFTEPDAYPAIPDTGTSVVCIPKSVFAGLQAEWAKDIPDLDCATDAENCRVPRACSEVMKQVKTVGFQMNDFVFSMPPEAWLTDDSYGCQLDLGVNNMPGKFGEVYLLGDTFLRHFYSTYDFDNDEVGLGVDIHAAAGTKIHSAIQNTNERIRSKIMKRDESMLGLQKLNRKNRN